MDTIDPNDDDDSLISYISNLIYENFNKDEIAQFATFAASTYYYDSFYPYLSNALKGIKLPENFLQNNIQKILQQVKNIIKPLPTSTTTLDFEAFKKEVVKKNTIQNLITDDQSAFQNTDNIGGFGHFNKQSEAVNLKKFQTSLERQLQDKFKVKLYGWDLHTDSLFQDPFRRSLLENTSIELKEVINFLKPLTEESIINNHEIVENDVVKWLHSKGVAAQAAREILDSMTKGDLTGLPSNIRNSIDPKGLSEYIQGVKDGLQNNASTATQKWSEFKQYTPDFEVYDAVEHELRATLQNTAKNYVKTGKGAVKIEPAYNNELTSIFKQIYNEEETAYISMKLSHINIEMKEPSQQMIDVYRDQSQYPSEFLYSLIDGDGDNSSLQRMSKLVSDKIISNESYNKDIFLSENGYHKDPKTNKIRYEFMEKSMAFSSKFPIFNTGDIEPRWDTLITWGKLRSLKDFYESAGRLVSQFTETMRNIDALKIQTETNDDQWPKFINSPKYINQQKYKNYLQETIISTFSPIQIPLYKCYDDLDWYSVMFINGYSNTDSFSLMSNQIVHHYVDGMGETTSVIQANEQAKNDFLVKKQNLNKFNNNQLSNLEELTFGKTYHNLKLLKTELDKGIKTKFFYITEKTIFRWGQIQKHYTALQSKFDEYQQNTAESKSLNIDDIKKYENQVEEQYFLEMNSIFFNNQSWKNIPIKTLMLKLRTVASNPEYSRIVSKALSQWNDFLITEDMIEDQLEEETYIKIIQGKKSNFKPVISKLWGTEETIDSSMQDMQIKLNRIIKIKNWNNDIETMNNNIRSTILNWKREKTAGLFNIQLNIEKIREKNIWEFINKLRILNNHLPPSDLKEKTYAALFSTEQFLDSIQEVNYSCHQWMFAFNLTESSPSLWSWYYNETRNNENFEVKWQIPRGVTRVYDSEFSGKIKWVKTGMSGTIGMSDIKILQDSNRFVNKTFKSSALYKQTTNTNVNLNEEIQKCHEQFNTCVEDLKKTRNINNPWQSWDILKSIKSELVEKKFASDTWFECTIEERNSIFRNNPAIWNQMGRPLWYDNHGLETQFYEQIFANTDKSEIGRKIWKNFFNRIVRRSSTTNIEQVLEPKYFVSQLTFTSFKNNISEIQNAWSKLRNNGMEKEDSIKSELMEYDNNECEEILNLEPQKRIERVLKNIKDYERYNRWLNVQQFKEIDNNSITNFLQSSVYLPYYWYIKTDEYSQQSLLKLRQKGDIITFQPLLNWYEQNNDPLFKKIAQTNSTILKALDFRHVTFQKQDQGLINFLKKAVTTNNLKLTVGTTSAILVSSIPFIYTYINRTKLDIKQIITNTRNDIESSSPDTNLLQVEIKELQRENNALKKQIKDTGIKNNLNISTLRYQHKQDKKKIKKEIKDKYVRKERKEQLLQAYNNLKNEHEKLTDKYNQSKGKKIKNERDEFEKKYNELLIKKSEQKLNYAEECRAQIQQLEEQLKRKASMTDVGSLGDSDLTGGEKLKTEIKQTNYDLNQAHISLVVETKKNETLLIQLKELEDQNIILNQEKNKLQDEIKMQSDTHGKVLDWDTSSENSESSSIISESSESSSLDLDNPPYKVAYDNLLIERNQFDTDRHDYYRCCKKLKDIINLINKQITGKGEFKTIEDQKIDDNIETYITDITSENYKHTTNISELENSITILEKDLTKMEKNKESVNKKVKSMTKNMINIAKHLRIFEELKFNIPSNYVFESVDKEQDISTLENFISSIELELSKIIEELRYIVSFKHVIDEEFHDLNNSDPKELIVGVKKQIKNQQEFIQKFKKIYDKIKNNSTFWDTDIEKCRVTQDTKDEISILLQMFKTYNTIFGDSLTLKQRDIGNIVDTRKNTQLKQQLFQELLNSEIFIDFCAKKKFEKDISLQTIEEICITAIDATNTNVTKLKANDNYKKFVDEIVKQIKSRVNQYTILNQKYNEVKKLIPSITNVQKKIIEVQKEKNGKIGSILREIVSTVGQIV